VLIEKRREIKNLVAKEVNRKFLEMPERSAMIEH